MGYNQRAEDKAQPADKATIHPVLRQTQICIKFPLVQLLSEMQSVACETSYLK